MIARYLKAGLIRKSPHREEPSHCPRRNIRITSGLLVTQDLIQCNDSFCLSLRL
jgi:hypothetical protein